MGKPLKFQLLNEALFGKRGEGEIGFGFLGGLLVPVRAAGVGGGDGVFVRKSLKFQLRNQTLPGEGGKIQITVGALQCGARTKAGGGNAEKYHQKQQEKTADFFHEGHSLG